MLSSSALGIDCCNR